MDIQEEGWAVSSTLDINLDTTQGKIVGTDWQPTIKLFVTST